MVKVDRIEQIRNFKRLEQVDAYKKWYKNIPNDISEELNKKEIELFCESMNARSPLEYSFWEKFGIMNNSYQKRMRRRLTHDTRGVQLKTLE